MPRVDGEPSFAPDFAAGLLDPARAEPRMLATASGGRVEKRYAVYRNNVTFSLVRALSEVFPVVERLVGQDFFAGMAREFVRAHPPSSQLLFRYGAEFPAFLEAFEPVAALPYLPDVARLERAWLDAWHAADAEPLAPEALTAIPPDALGAALFAPHPAMRLLRSDYAVGSIFLANRGGSPGQPIDGAVAEAVLVTRPALAMSVEIVPVGAFVLIDRLAQGETFGAAVAAAAEQTGEFDLGAALALILRTGAFSGVSTATHTSVRGET